MHQTKQFCSNRIKDAGIAIRHSQGYIISILQGPEMSLGVVATHLRKKLNFQAVIKSAASTASRPSPKTKIQESRGA